MDRKSRRTSLLLVFFTGLLFLSVCQTAKGPQSARLRFGIYFDGEVDYGERAEHCWNGDHTRPNAISRLRYHQRATCRSPLPLLAMGLIQRSVRE